MEAVRIQSLLDKQQRDLDETSTLAKEQLRQLQVRHFTGRSELQLIAVAVSGSLVFLLPSYAGASKLCS